MTTTIDYIGSELDVFAHARNWKAYWASQIERYVGQRVLDVGAGLGATAQALKGKAYARWVELEPDARLCGDIAKARDNGLMPANCEIVNGVAADLPAEPAFDTILYVDVLEHIEDDAAELAVAAQRLGRGGHIVVVGPAHNYLYTEFDRRIGHFRRYDRAALSRLTPAGFEVVALRYLDSVGILASLANKLLLKSGSPTVAQIRTWDRLIVPLSRILDPILRHTLGKSIVYVVRKVD